MPPRRKPDQTAPKPASPPEAPTEKQLVSIRAPSREVSHHRPGSAAA